MSKDPEIAVSLSHICEYYKIKFSYPDRTEEKEVKALEDINLTLYKGESLAVLGPNGAGKTTLLKIIAGLLNPYTGEAKINGEVRGIFELGAGFMPELTGFENLKYTLSFYNVEVDEKILKDIIEFSELEDFIYAPLKTYSGGMYLRLAFSLAINTNPDILLVDDILTVGDFYFQKKCVNKIKDLISKGKTIILVTHNYNLAESLCNRCIILEKGKIIAEGRPSEIKNIFLNIDGNVWGLGFIEDKETKLIFNNGRISLIHNNLPLTADLGIFASFKKDKGILYSTDFKWNVFEQVDKIEAYGLFNEETVFSLKIQLKERHLNFLLESKYPETDLNFMLSSNYTQIQTKDKIINLPAISEKPMREWLKVTQISSNYIKLIPLNPANYPSLSFLSGYKSEFELFNFNFNTSARIVKLNVFESKLNLKIILLGDIEIKTQEHKKIKILDDVLERINNLLIAESKIEKPVFQTMYFLNYLHLQQQKDYECEILDSNISSGFKTLIHFPEHKFSLLFTASVKNSKTTFSFSSVKDGVSKFLNGIGMFLPIVYKDYSSSYGEGRILSEYGAKNFPAIFTARWLTLIPNQKGYPELKIKFNKDTQVEIKNIYEIGITNLKFLQKIIPDEYIIEITL